MPVRCAVCPFDRSIPSHYRQTVSPRASATTLARVAEQVVITGLGVVSALGVGIEALWEGLVGGRSGIAPIDAFDASGFPCRHWARVTDLAVRDHVPKSYRKSLKVMARDTELAVVAADLAVKHAAMTTRANEGAAPTYPSCRVGCSIGAGLIAAEAEELATALATSTDERGAFSLRRWGTIPPGDGGMASLPPLWLLKYLPNMPACHVTIIHGAEGPSNTITCGEASGLLSIGESMRVIQRGGADACFAGGTESKLNLMGLLRMTFAGRLADTSAFDDPASIVRPYDPDAAGTVLGEGAGILILENARTAHARGASPIAALQGFGAAQSLSADPPDVNLGLANAIRAALHDADASPDEIDAIAPQACGCQAIDCAELGALRRVFGDTLARIPLITITPSIGETNAARGGIQVAVAATAIRNGRVPARLHAGRPLAGTLAAAAPSETRALRRVLVCTSALGGQNAALVLGPAA